MKKFFVGVFAFFCAVVMISCGEASKSIYVHGDETNDGETSDVDADDDKTGDVETEDVDADDTEPNSGDTRNAQCGSKPENTEWNDGGANGNFVQTFDGETWEPELSAKLPEHAHSNAERVSAGQEPNAKLPTPLTAQACRKTPNGTPFQP